MDLANGARSDSSIVSAYTINTARSASQQPQRTERTKEHAAEEELYSSQRGWLSKHNKGPAESTQPPSSIRSSDLVVDVLVAHLLLALVLLGVVGLGIVLLGTITLIDQLRSLVGVVLSRRGLLLPSCLLPRRHVDN